MSVYGGRTPGECLRGGLPRPPGGRPQWRPWSTQPPQPPQHQHPAERLPRRPRRWLAPLGLFAAVAVVYLTTISPDPSPDVFSADFAALHIARTGDPVPHIPDFPRLDDNIIRETWIVETADGREAVGRAPGVIAVAVPAYWLLRPDTVSAIPGGITAALLAAGTVTLLFLTLRERIGGRHALLAAALFGLATPMWSVAANGVWPHTLTTFGIVGMAWAADRGRWWLVGLFGGLMLWGRLHAAADLRRLRRRRWPGRGVGRRSRCASASRAAGCWR